MFLVICVATVLFPQSLGEVQLDSTSCSADCHKSIARHFRICYATPRFRYGATGLANNATKFCDTLQEMLAIIKKWIIV